MLQVPDGYNFFEEMIVLDTVTHLLQSQSFSYKHVAP